MTWSQLFAELRARLGFWAPLLVPLFAAGLALIGW